MMSKQFCAVWSLAVALLAGCGGQEESSAAGNCTYGDKSYPDGASFQTADGCNSCTCTAGVAACTQRACAPSCSEIISQYGVAVEASKACDPRAATNPCTKPFVEGLACGCATFANPEHQAELEQAQALQDAYTAQSCQQGVVCGPCQAPISAHCSAQGHCEDDYEP